MQTERLRQLTLHDQPSCGCVHRPSGTILLKFSTLPTFLVFTNTNLFFKKRKKKPLTILQKAPEISMIHTYYAFRPNLLKTRNHLKMIWWLRYKRCNCRVGCRMSSNKGLVGCVTNVSLFLTSTALGLSMYQGSTQTLLSRRGHMWTSAFHRSIRISVETLYHLNNLLDAIDTRET